jgi:hypothetical protein
LADQGERLIQAAITTSSVPRMLRISSLSPLARRGLG